MCQFTFVTDISKIHRNIKPTHTYLTLKNFNLHIYFCYIVTDFKILFHLVLPQILNKH